MAVHSYPVPAEVDYPTSDGQPMAESDLHRRVTTDLIDRLERRYRDRDDVYVSGNNLVYYVEGDPTKGFAPDVYVVVGVPKGDRRVYKIWEEGRPPTVVFEITSPSTAREDSGPKLAKCAGLGVQEYWLFDPEGAYLEPSVQGFRLRSGRYERIPATAEGLVSETLGLLARANGGRLELRDRETGETVLTPAEAAQAETEAARAEIERLRATLEGPDARADGH